MADKSYIGKGKVYLNGRQVGNVTALNVQIAEEKIELKDYTSAGGGNYNSLTRIDSVTMSLNMSDYNPENLAMALFGSSAAVTATTVTDESVAAPADLTGNPLVKTTTMIDTAQTVTVTSDPAGTTHVEGTDYELSAAGIIIIDGGGITASDPLLVSYTKKAVDLVQALTTTAQEYELILDGLNEAQGGDPVIITAFRFKPGPAADLAFIGDEFAELALSGDALKDTSITSAGLSQYMTIASA